MCYKPTSTYIYIYICKTWSNLDRLHRSARFARFARSLARCARPTTEAQFGISWRARDLIKQIKNNKYNRQTLHRLCIPIVYLSTALLGLLEQPLGAILGRINIILGRLVPSCTVLAPFWAVLTPS